MLLCLVTDRRRTDPVAQARAAATAGIDFIHIRERDLEAAALASLVRTIVAAVRSAGTAARGRTRVLVNDRVDVAIACGADGVHLRADGIRVSEARRIAPPGFVVGRSVHAADEASASSDADFLVAGTVLPTASKPEQRRLLGESGLGQIVAATKAPVLAIGGMSLDTVASAARAGAAGIAAIGLFGGPEPLGVLVPTLRTRFDSAKTAS